MNVSWILMHGRSVRNLIAGRKTQTRRIIKPQPKHNDGRHMRTAHRYQFYGGGYADSGEVVDCPYGQPGDLLYVRETIEYLNVGWGHHVPVYSANRQPVHWQIELPTNRRVIPSIFMPRRSSRLTLRLTDVRVERVQDISTEDCMAEGLSKWPHKGDWAYGDAEDAPHGHATPTGAFHKLWDDTNGFGAWDRNDWVWVLSFDIIRANVDQVLEDPALYGIEGAA